METGYVIVRKLPDDKLVYYRGCARGRGWEPWAKTLLGAQIYISAKVAMATINSDKFNLVRTDCSIKRVKVEIEDI